MSRDSVQQIVPEGKGNSGHQHGHSHGGGGGGGGGHGHSHGTPETATPRTSLPSVKEMHDLPILGCINGVKGGLGWSIRNPLHFVVIATAALLLATSFFLTMKSFTYFKQDCWFGLIMRVLIARSIVILGDALYVHILCYKVVKHFKIAIKFTVNQIALLRINSKNSINARVCQSLVLLIPCAYFSFDKADGCNYLCCPNEDDTEMVPAYYADYSLLCMCTSIPLIVFVVKNLFRDPVEEGWLKQNAKKMAASGGAHKG